MDYLTSNEWYIKYFENSGKNMSFVIKHDVLDKYNEIWDKIKEKLNIKFHSMPVYNEKYIKAKENLMVWLDCIDVNVFKDLNSFSKAAITNALKMQNF